MVQHTKKLVNPGVHKNLQKKNVEPKKRLPKKSNTNNSAIQNMFFAYIANYFENTTLHGLRYVGDPTISFGERACWLLCFITAVLSAGYFVSMIYITYDKNPVLISVNAVPTPVSDIPFPTITVCNMNKIKRSAAKLINENGTEVEKNILLNYCGKAPQKNISAEIAAESSNWDNVLKFILKASQPCEEMLKLCKWRSKEISCEKWFNPILTDEGMCCTFNQMPNGFIFRYEDNFNELSYNYPQFVEDWTQETGYYKNAPTDAFPWRPAGAGVNLGLTLVLDAALHEYYCSTASSAGFKILMHNPLETPAMEDFGRMSVVGREAWLEIEPSVTETVSTLISISVDKRHCYFNSEKYLKFFRLYTQRNCKMECRTNYTLKMCDCVPYFLPREATNRICGFQDSNCTINAEMVMQIAEVHDEAICHCLPGCFDLSFEKNGHYGKMHSFTVGKHMLSGMPLDYFVENAAIIHFYFYSPLLTKFVKRELYGFSEFLSSTGGLLGLFLGFSFLSAVELGYYLSLRILCLVVRSKENNESREIKRKENGVIFPFVN